MQNGIIPKLLTGLTPLMLDSHTLRIEAGVAAVAGSNPDCWIEIPGNTQLSILSVGPWGLDRPLWVGWAYLWGIADSTGVLPGACILSPSALGGGLIIPPGYDRIRYLPYAVYIKGSSAGMRLQLVTSWPFPCKTIYQDQGIGHQFSAGPTDGAWQTVNLSLWVPTDARLAHLQVYSEAVSGPGGHVFVRTPGCGDGGFALGPDSHQTTRFVAMSSNENIEVRTSPLTEIWLRVVGYETLSTY